MPFILVLGLSMCKVNTCRYESLHRCLDQEKCLLPRPKAAQSLTLVLLGHGETKILQLTPAHYDTGT